MSIVKQQVGKELLLTYFQAKLSAHIGESLSKFQKETSNVVHQFILNVMLVKFLPYGKKIKLVRVFGYLLRQVALHGRKRGLKVGDSLSVSLIQVGSKPVEKSITSPIVFPCFSKGEQGFVHIALAS